MKSLLCEKPDETVPPVHSYPMVVNIDEDKTHQEHGQQGVIPRVRGRLIIGVGIESQVDRCDTMI